MIMGVTAMKSHQNEKHNNFYYAAFGDPRPFSCEKCQATFECQDKLQNHNCKAGKEVFFKRKKKGEPVEAIKCHLCDKSFSKNHVYRLHLSTFHTKEKTFECDQCKYKTKTAYALTQHKSKVHDKLLPHVCHVCGKGFFYPAILKIHLDSVHGNVNETKSHVCERCGKSFSKMSSFRFHVKSHQMFDLCTICEKIFTARTKLREHLVNEHGLKVSEDHLFVCSVCEKTHTSSIQLNEHIHVEHKMPKILPCAQCDKGFTTKTVLTLHLMEFHEFNPIESVSYKAELADARSNHNIGTESLALNSMHVVEDHNLKGVRCNLCGKMLSCNRSLSDHKRQVHDKANHIKCDQCNFTTFQPYMLKRHVLQIHDKSVKYECNECDFFAYNNSRIRVHKRRIHQNIRPNKCSECERDFITKNNLAVHMLKEHNIVYKYK
jgi:hypothetical protein